MQSNSDVQVTSTGGALTALSIIPDEYRVRDDVQYTIGFTTTNELPLGSQVQIISPSTMSFNKTNFTGFENEINFNEQGLLSYDESTRTIQILNAFTEVFSTSIPVKFKIKSGMVKL